MDYQQYLGRIQEAEVHLAQGHLKEAEAVFFQLAMSDISELDRADLYVRIAQIYDRLGNIEEALNWFDKGIASEQVFSRFKILEGKAEYLSQLGRHDAVLRIYEHLLKQLFLTEADKERVRKLIQIQLGKSLSTWR